MLCFHTWSMLLCFKLCDIQGVFTREACYYVSYYVIYRDLPEITPTFGGVTARAVEGIQWWEWSRWLAAVLPFSDDAVGWSGEHRGFVVETFVSRTVNLISLRGDIGWPARSSDLTPCDFFLWGFIKAKVYARRLGTIEQLKEAIRQEVAAIPPAMTRKAMDNFRERLQLCVINNGRHLSDVIFESVLQTALHMLCINKISFCVPCFVWFFIALQNVGVISATPCM